MFLSNCVIWLEVVVMVAEELEGHMDNHLEEADLVAMEVVVADTAAVVVDLAAGVIVTDRTP